MKRGILLFVLVLFAGVASAAPNDEIQLSAGELQDLAAPVALYPDPLLGLILPASVFPDQIVDAALLIKGKSDAELISSQNWDASVKGIATYPGVLKMMFEKIDWTTKLGVAFLNQSDGLRDAIQALRVKAQSVGNLKTSDEQQVTSKVVNGETVIRIEPTSPQVVYVPQYSTQVVYTEPAPASSNYLVPLATFGLGMALGSAMADDDDDVHIYGGYPGRVAWYDNDSVDNWVDNRQDMIRDAQDHKQGVQNDRINYRQDMKEDRQSFRQDQIESGNYKDPAARQEFSNQQAAKRQEYASSTKEARANNRASMASSASSSEYAAKKQQAQQRTQEWKSTAADRGYGSGSANSRTTANNRQSTSRASSGSAYSSSASRSTRSSSGSAFQGYSSKTSASAYGSRGSASRAAGGYSKGSYGGGGGARRGGGGGGRRR